MHILFICTGNIFRSLTAEYALRRALPPGMSNDHQQFVRSNFARELPLFTEVCGLAAEPLPDVDDVVPEFEVNEAAAAAHIRFIIDQIVVLAPRLAARIVQRDPMLLRWMPAGSR